MCLKMKLRIAHPKSQMITIVFDVGSWHDKYQIAADGDWKAIGDGCDQITGISSVTFRVNEQQLEPTKEYIRGRGFVGKTLEEMDILMALQLPFLGIQV